jgi:hypothetical protein
MSASVAWTLLALSRFVDVVEGSGIDLVVTFGGAEKRYIIEYTGTGAGLVDYDGDGDLDLYLVDGSALELPPGAPPPRDRLYRNEGGFRFVDVTDEAGLGATGWGGGVLAGDVDNDGDPDLLVTNFGPNVLYRNNGDGTFTDVTERSGLVDSRWHSSAAFGDLDADGFLDLYVTNHAVFDPDAPPPLPCYWKGVSIACGPLAHVPETHLLYRNRGGGSFEDVSSPSGVAVKAGFGFGVVMDYFDDDEKLDVYVANDLTENFLFLNRTGEGEILFEDASALSGAGYVEGGREQAGMGVDSGDYDGNGRPDLYVTNFSDDYNTLYRSDGGGLFTDVTFESGLGSVTFPFLAWGTAFADFDLDADLDLFVVNGHIYPEADRVASGTSYAQSNQLFVNEGGRRFRDVSREAGLTAKRLGRGAAFGDVDDDGDVDAVVANMHALPSLLRNDSATGRSFLQLLLVGTASNRDGVGARVELTEGGRRQHRTSKAGGSYLSSHDPRIHFGLGTGREVERVIVRWPSGERQALGPLEAGRVYVVKEGVGEP